VTRRRQGVHILLGASEDPGNDAIREALARRGHSTWITPNPLVEPFRFSWQLDNERSATSVGLEDHPAVRNEQIESVLVFHAGWIEPTGWQPHDLAYVQAETQAALLAWLWSLDCPVVNRYPPSIWYRPQAPLLAWRKLLDAAGLSTPETVVTNVEEEARSFARRIGSDGVVYGPLTSDIRYLVTSEDDWRSLIALQRVTPVHLSAPHREPRTACVVGSDVVWDVEPPRELSRLEPALRRFAAAAGLSVVELAIAEASGRLSVVAVQSHPRFDGFSEAARATIVDGIVDLLTTGSPR
jgi:hypothetical protein